MFYCCLLSADRCLPANPEYARPLDILPRQMVENDGRLTVYLIRIKGILHQ